MIALLLGSVLAVLGLSYVLWPLLRGAVFLPMGDTSPREQTDGASAMDALREIEFDQATGKLSAEDYAALTASYTPRALEEMRALEAADVQGAGSPHAAAIDADLDPAEALIARARAVRAAGCGSCGSRPEPHALFCSECGTSLAAWQAKAHHD